MNIKPLVLYLSCKEQIGITTETLKEKPALMNPYLAQYMDNGRVFISSSEFVDSNVFPMLGKTRYVGMNTFLAVDEEKRRVIEIDWNSNLLWSFSYSHPQFKPVCFDKFPSGEIAIIDAGRRRILSVDEENNQDWNWQPSDMELKEPVSLQCLDNGNLLVADSELHVVFEVTNGGKILWMYGTPNYPGEKENQLAYPSSAIRLVNGNTLIADSMNHRVLEVNLSGSIIWRYGKNMHEISNDNLLYWPIWADRNSNGNTLITDYRNHRIIEVDKNGKSTQQYGDSPFSKRFFSFPRSLQLLGNEEILLADTANNRIVRLNKAREIVWFYGTGQQGDSQGTLFWPRSAQYLSNNHILISDGRNGRVILVDENKRIVREIKEYFWSGNRYLLSDPHYAVMLATGKVMVVDSINHTVVEISEDNQAMWLYGPQSNCNHSLQDPHYVAVGLDGRVLIADSGNHRIVMINKERDTFWSCEKVQFENKDIYLYWPRFCTFVEDNLILFVDGGTGFIFIINEDQQVLRCYQASDNFVQLALKKTRSIQFESEDEILVSDIYYSRILKLNIINH